MADDILHAISADNVVSFKPGRTDRAEQLAIPRKLYGRDKSIAKLTDQLERAKQGEVLFSCISGSSGMGKTALADHAFRMATDLNAIPTRVDASTIEFADTDTLIIELMRPAIRHLLSMPEEQAAGTIAKLRESTKRHADLRSLLPHIPEIATFLDEHTPAPGLPRRGLHALLAAIAPTCLVMIVEDAQSVPAECIEALLNLTLSNRGVLVIFTWEQYDQTPFETPRIATKTAELELHLLDRADLRAMLGDMLGHSEARVRELAGEIHNKTDGIPALVLELIFELHDAGHIVWDRTSAQWALGHGRSRPLLLQQQFTRTHRQAGR